MASASVKLITTKIVTLTLDENEAEVLAFILNRVGGHPNNSPRKYADQIHCALISQKILDNHLFECHMDDPSISFIDFK